MRQERWGLRDAAPIHREAVFAWLTLILSSGSSTLPSQCKNHNFSVATTITVGMYRQNHRFCRAMGMTAPPSVSNTWKNQFKGLLPQNWHLPLRKNWQNSLNMMPLVQSWLFLQRNAVSTPSPIVTSPCRNQQQIFINPFPSTSSYFDSDYTLQWSFEMCFNFHETLWKKLNILLY